MVLQFADFDCLQIDRVGADMLKKQFCTANERWSSGLGFREGLTTLTVKSNFFFVKFYISDWEPLLQQNMDWNGKCLISGFR
jgi:hypothetical protein